MPICKKDFAGTGSRVWKLALFFVSGLMFLPASAFAEYELSAQGALDFNTNNYGFASSPSFLWGFALTKEVSYPFQVGFAYEHNSLSYTAGGSGSLNFYGLIGRMKTASPLFFDLQVGLDERESNGISFSWGTGVGYTFPLSPSIEIAPRMGYRFVPDGGIERSLLDIGGYLTLRLQ